MPTRYSPDPGPFAALGTQALRSDFLVDSLFKVGELGQVYSDADRAVFGWVVPTGTALALAAQAELRAAYFCERRELGILNIGGGWFGGSRGGCGGEFDGVTER